MQNNTIDFKKDSFEELIHIFTDITDEKFMKEFIECLFITDMIDFIDLP